MILTATPATLAAVLAKALPGDTITATGTHGALRLKGRTGLTIVGLRAESLTVTGGSDLRFTECAIASEPAFRHSPMVSVVDASNVDFKGLTVAAAPSASDERKGYAFTVNRCKNVSVAGLVVTGAAKGMVLGASSGIAVRGARLSDLRSDGVQFGDIAGLLLEDLTVERIRPVRTGPVSTHDHGDGIQGVAPSSDVTIRRFWFVDGADGQGIFISDARAPARYQRVRVEGAVMATTHARALHVDRADGVYVRDVVCLTGGEAKPGIYLTEVTGADVARTLAAVHVRDKGVPVELDRVERAWR